VRALLDLMRANEAAAQKKSFKCAAVLGVAFLHLTILDPEVGEGGLIQEVAAALASLRMP